ncbi:DUF4432 family protein [Glaciibacter psychrotolerans]|uniref:Galactose mutarotase-like enzyme n=1 Tax=Glaciibacter psychrotolerans TaxID=670054 RepID=A0A7Z0EHK3_9MICO|nr:DUF4432 family protein [Leifsonia psychrotolerans]NYJ21661.1 galactose mutarotase-like enzyme [Leifsonia psychrotolerans]
MSKNDDVSFTLTNEFLSIEIDPNQGADLVSLMHRESGEELLWRDPRTSARSGTAPLPMFADSFYDTYRGGMQELFPNTADSSVVMGVTLPFHGEACQLAWSVRREHRYGSDRLVCMTDLTRYPVRMERTISLVPGEPTLRIRSEIVNLSARALPYTWAMHPAFSRAVTAEPSVLYAPFACAVSHPDKFSENQSFAPGEVVGGGSVEGVSTLTLNANDAGTTDLLYAQPDQGWYTLRNESSGLTVSMGWPVEQFPELWIWQECRGVGDFPWWGQHHIVAVEPHVASPSRALAEHIVAGTARELAPHGRLSAEFTLSAELTSLDQIPQGLDTRGRVVLRQKEKEHTA